MSLHQNTEQRPKTPTLRRVNPWIEAAHAKLSNDLALTVVAGLPGEGGAAWSIFRTSELVKSGRSRSVEAAKAAAAGPLAAYLEWDSEWKAAFVDDADVYYWLTAEPKGQLWQWRGLKQGTDDFKMADGTAPTFEDSKASAEDWMQRRSGLAIGCGRVYMLSPMGEPKTPCVLPAGHQASEQNCRDAQGRSWLYGASEDPAAPRLPSVLRAERRTVPHVE